MDINIIDIREDELSNIIKQDDKVIEYHDLHIYKPSSKQSFISFHIVMDDENSKLKECESVSDSIKHELAKQDFNHILIQIDN